MSATTEEKSPLAGGQQGKGDQKHPQYNTLLHEAQAAIDRGWRLTRCKGKIPCDTGWPDLHLDANTIQKHICYGGNIGVICGAASGIVVIDFDAPLDEPDEKIGLLEKLPDTPTVVTPGNGLHLYYLLPEGVTLGNSAGKLCEGVDVKADRGQVVLPGSVHPNGKFYKWQVSPDDLALANLPGWIVERLTEKPKPTPPPPPGGNGHRPPPEKYIAAAINGEAEAVRTAPQGQRNHILNCSSLKLASLGIEDHVIEAALIPAAIEAGLSEREIQGTIRSGIEAGRKTPRSIPESRPVTKARPGGERANISTDRDLRTDLANAQRLAKAFGDELRHSQSLGWLSWDGRRWAPSEKDALARASMLGSLIRAEIKNIDLSDKAGVDMAGDLARWALRSESAAAMASALTVAKVLSPINADSIQFDTNPWLLNCLNGTVDLQTGILHPHKPADNITKLCPVEYDSAARCPRWIQFLDEVFNGDRDVINYVAWAAGLVLTGHTDAQTFYVLHGVGSNGKSTFLNVLAEILGPDYSRTIPAEELLFSFHERHSTERAGLRGVRLAVALETPGNARLNEVLIKSLTGGEAIRARFLYRDSFEFRPELKLWIATNHKPKIRDNSKGFWRRIRLVPFEIAFEGDRRDTGIMAKLRAEYPGILKWLVDMARGAAIEPVVPSAIRAATDSYQAESDILLNFLNEVCLSTNSEADCVPKSLLYAKYEAWTDGKAESQRSFTKMMRDRGYLDAIRGENRNRVWIGIRLIDNAL